MGNLLNADDNVLLQCFYSQTADSRQIFRQIEDRQTSDSKQIAEIQTERQQTDICPMVDRQTTFRSRQRVD